jgi:integrase
LPLAPALVDLLRKWRAAQVRERLLASNQWIDSGLVFTTELGGPVDPRNLLRVVETAARAAGLTDVDVHTLRHSAAAQLMEHGAHIKLVADVLGHSSIAVTGDIYGHTSQGAARQALEVLASGGAR